MAAARKVFLAHGFGAATTDMIQQAAGVSKSTVYAYYPNKDALFKAVVEAECERFVGAIRELKTSGQNLEAVLTETARTYLDGVLSSNVLAFYRVIVAEGPRFPELAARFYAAGPGAMNKLVAAMLRDSMAQWDLDFGGIGVEAAAALFVNMIRGEAQMQTLTHPGSPPSAVQRDQWVLEAVTTFIRAFHQRGKTLHRPS